MQFHRPEDGGLTFPGGGYAAGFDIYVETGVGDGRTFQRAAQAFPDIRGIEMQPEKVAAVAAALEGRENFSVITGDSAKHLYLMLDPDKKTLIFLDAHADSIHPRSPQCPVLDELRQIMAAGWTAGLPTIVIDDAHCFTGGKGPLPGSPGPFPGWKRNEWPTVAEIDAMIGTWWDVKVEGDLIVCRPLPN